MLHMQQTDKLLQEQKLSISSEIIIITESKAHTLHLHMQSVWQKCIFPPTGVPRILQWRALTRVDPGFSKTGASQGTWGREVPQWGPGTKPCQGVGVTKTPEAEAKCEISVRYL